MVGLGEEVVFHGDGRGEFEEGFVVDLVFGLEVVGKILFPEVEEGFGEFVADLVKGGEVGGDFSLFSGEVVFDPKRK